MLRIMHSLYVLCFGASLIFYLEVSFVFNVISKTYPGLLDLNHYSGVRYHNKKRMCSLLRDGANRALL